MNKTKILFVCVHNSARSQMAAAWLNHLCGRECEASSAGFEAGTLNPLAVEAMAKLGIDISGNQTQSVLDVFRSGKLFSYVVTVCDRETEERCPIFPGITHRLAWSFPDPAKVAGSHDEKLRQVEEIRDAIRARLEEWRQEVCGVNL